MFKSDPLPGAEWTRAARCLPLLCLFPLLLARPCAPYQKTDTARAGLEQSLAAARTAFDRGEFEIGIRALNKALEGKWGSNDTAGYSRAVVLLAEGYDALGRYTDSVKALEGALSLLPPGRDREQTAWIEDRLAMAYGQLGDADRARELIDRALQKGKESGRAEMQAALINDSGVLQSDGEDFEAALESFAESARLARESGLRELAATAALNQAGAAIRLGRSAGLKDLLAGELQDASGIPDTYRRSLFLLSTGSQYWTGQRLFGMDADWRSCAYEAYRKGLIAARSIGNRRLISYGLGSIGRLYEDERRFDEALRLTRQAAFEAQLSNAPDVLYQWEWQIARVLKERGDVEQAIAGYRRAISTLESIRDSVSRSAIPFQTLVGPVFRELADLLLRRASVAADSRAAQQDLIEVRATLEKLKQAEVADYFRDDCSVQSQGTTQLDSLAAKAAVLYPVLLSDRTELLLSTGGALKHVSVSVGLQELTSIVRDFRQSIDTYDTGGGFMPLARRLYELLVKPLAEDLRREAVTTLVVVPDGPLRTIPFAALHDGESFLVERLAVVTTPGLTLTSAEPLPRANVRTLAGGLTASVQGFNALPSVNNELAGIATLFPTVRLQDRTFRTSGVESAVSQGGYSIVHLATHGHFDSDHRKSYLLTYDGRITLDALQNTVGRRRYRKEPVELLVLSACETASGDDRAALGLAGAGLRAGSRSVVATLWPISDVSTATLISEFYRKLKDPKFSKAEALRAAQLALLAQERFRHPFFWAPFLLIGNWL